MANGQTITRKVGFIIISVGEFRTVDEVVFGQPGDLQLLGARTLEGFGAIVDSRKKAPSGGWPASCCLSLYGGPDKPNGDEGADLLMLAAIQLEV